MQQSERLQRMCDGRYDLETRTLDENLSTWIHVVFDDKIILKGIHHQVFMNNEWQNEWEWVEGADNE